MRRPPLHALLLALAVALLAPPAPPAARRREGRSDRASHEAPQGAGKPAVVKRGLETILQDDGLFLFRPVAEIEAAVARAKALGIDTIRITAGWSSLTRGVDQPAKPEGFDARDPGSYEQARWRALDAADPRDPRRRPARARRHRLLGAALGDDRPRPAGAREHRPAGLRRLRHRRRAALLRRASRRRPTRRTRRRRRPTPDQSLLQSILQPFVPFPIPDPLGRSRR